MKKSRLKKGDTVVVITGKDRGRHGKVLQIMPGKGRILIEHVNMVKKHLRPNPGKNIAGGITERESPMAISNVMLLDPEKNVPTRLSRRRTADGHWERVARKSGAVVE